MHDKRYWLFKTDPETFSIRNLQEEGITPWDGVRNPEARNYIRDHMQPGQKVLFYHSGTRKEKPAVVGLATIVSEPMIDPTAFDRSEKYYDHSSSRDNPRWYMVDLRYDCRFDQPIDLEELRLRPGLESMRLLKPGHRLTIQPVTEAEWNTIIAMRPVTAETVDQE